MISHDFHLGIIIELEEAELIFNNIIEMIFESSIKVIQLIFEFEFH